MQIVSIIILVYWQECGFVLIYDIITSH